MIIQTRGSPSRSVAGAVGSPAANLAMEMITADQVLQWTLEGNCYTASVPLQTDGIDGRGNHDDTAQAFMLTSDLNGTKLIVPLVTTISPNSVSASSAAQEYSIAVIRPTTSTLVRRTVSGTSMTIHNNRSDGYGNQVATALYTVTSSALDGTGDWNEICAFHVNINSDDNANVGIGEHTVQVCHFKDMAPIILCKGASLSVQTWSSGGTA